MDPDDKRIRRLLILFCLFPTVLSQCPQVVRLYFHKHGFFKVSSPCHCAPSIYEPIAIICENAGSLSNALQAITNARQMPVRSNKFASLKR